MSNTKFRAAKELIQEEEYDAARAILETIDHATADKWLKRIDEIDPPFPDDMTNSNSEQDAYYKRENRRARMRKIGNGIYTMVMGFVMLGIWSLFSGLLTGRIISDPYSGMNLLMLVMAILLIVFGFFRAT